MLGRKLCYHSSRNCIRSLLLCFGWQQGPFYYFVGKWASSGAFWDDFWRRNLFSGWKTSEIMALSGGKGWDLISNWKSGLVPLGGELFSLLPLGDGSQVCIFNSIAFSRVHLASSVAELCWLEKLIGDQYHHGLSAYTDQILSIFRYKDYFITKLWKKWSRFFSFTFSSSHSENFRQLLFQPLQL